MNSGSWAATNDSALAATASTSSVRRRPESASSCGIAAFRPLRASAAIVGLVSGTCSLARQCSARRPLSGGEDAQRARNRRQRQQQLGLVVGILEGAGGVVLRNAGGLL